MALYSYGPRYLRPYKVMARTYTDAVHEGGVRMNVCTDVWAEWHPACFMGLLASPDSLALLFFLKPRAMDMPSELKKNVKK